MASGWLPRDGQEWTEWVGQELRLLRRHRHPHSLGEIPGAIDGSGGVDTSPISDFYVEGDDDYPLPEQPLPGTPPPDGEEDSSGFDAPTFESGGMTRASSTATTGSNPTWVTAWEFDQEIVPGFGPEMVEVGDDFIPTFSGRFSVRVHYLMIFSGTPSSVFITANGATTTALGDTTVNQFGVIPAATLEEYRSLGTYFLYGNGEDPTMPTVATMGFSVQWTGAVTLTSLEVDFDITRVT